MTKEEQQLERIATNYILALNFLEEDNDFKAATKQLYQVMDHKDYDLSIDIMYNMNQLNKNEDLKNLILKVDNLLVNYSEEVDDDELFQDSFNGGIF